MNVEVCGDSSDTVLVDTSCIESNTERPLIKRLLIPTADQ
jgi:hypothetical protein